VSRDPFQPVPEADAESDAVASEDADDRDTAASPAPELGPDDPAAGPDPGHQTEGRWLEAAPTAVELGLELPDDPEATRAILLRELAEARQDAGELLETLQRVAADFDNFRRRVQRDQAENVERASQRVVESLLPTLDSFDAALAYEPVTPSEEKLLDGMRSTHLQLLETLARVGFEPIPAAGEHFDPKVHEAVSGPGGDGDGELVVSAELRRGYTLHGRVIRPSLVAVGHA
jgi:molecular chaperone GrpE